jgi:putative ABC transport system permease protein
VNLASISFAYLRARNTSTVLNTVLLAFSVAAITLLVLTSEQLQDRMHFNARGFDLVVAPKGSGLQAVLSNVYQLEPPIAAIPWREAQAITSRPGVNTAIPVAAVDHYRGVRVIGTTPEYLEHYGARVRAGARWHHPFQAVVGSEAAARTGLRVGSTFTVAHAGSAGAEAVHQETYRVVGVLWPSGTVSDRLIVTDLASVWTQHIDSGESEDGLVREPPMDEGREVNAILVETTSPDAAAALAHEINAGTTLQAVSPATESARLFGAIIVGMRLLRAFAIVLVIAAGFSVFIALYSALSERQYDLAIMRAMGASPRRLMFLLLFEGLMLAAIGTAIGVLLGHALTSAIGFAFRFEQAGVTGLTWSINELWIIGGALLIGMLAALLPAWRAHETDIARVLARG